MLIFIVSRTDYLGMQLAEAAALAAGLAAGHFSGARPRPVRCLGKGGWGQPFALLGGQLYR